MTRVDLKMNVIVYFNKGQLMESVPIKIYEDARAVVPRLANIVMLAIFDELREGKGLD